MCSARPRSLAGLFYPAIWQWVVLGVAFLAEGYLVSVVVRKVPDIESRRFWLWMLFIVGSHFLILGPRTGRSAPRSLWCAWATPCSG
ncbi:MAG: hypothetical protein R2717_03315 [Schumannella sp.]